MKQEHVFIYKHDLTEKQISLKTDYIDLSIEEVLNLMRQYLLMIGYSDDTARRLRIAEEADDDNWQIHECSRG